MGGVRAGRTGAAFRPADNKSGRPYPLVQMGDDARAEGPGGERQQHLAEELQPLRRALEEAVARSAQRRRERPEADGPLDPTAIAYEMELAEHRSTIERLHRAELAARDVMIEHQQARIAELEAEVGRLRTALQVLTGRPLPEAGLTSSPEDEEH
jgi:hypothetical protein